MGDEHADIEPRLRPGAWDTEGFLLPGESLADRIATDLTTCSRIGTSPDAIGGQLAELLSAAAGSDRRRPHTIGAFRVEVLRQRGLLTCPWAPDEFEPCPAGGDGLPTANRFRIVHGRSTLEGFALSAHLIRAHRFFGGTGTRYRIDPETAASVLGLP